MEAVVVAPLMAVVVEQLPTAVVVLPMAEVVAVLTAIVKIKALPKGPPFQ